MGEKTLILAENLVDQAVEEFRAITELNLVETVIIQLSSSFSPPRGQVHHTMSISAKSAAPASNANQIMGRLLYLSQSMFSL
ncbi:MAG: hypothetical protein ACREUV_06420 [Burkholderiales bacterium]